jgi:type IV secretory pathway VirB9-like protein
MPLKTGYGITKKEHKMTDTKVVVNCTTGETSIVTLDSEEIAQREADALAFTAAEAARLEAAEAAQAAKESAHAMLAALFLSTEEIAALTR